MPPQADRVAGGEGVNQTAKRRRSRPLERTVRRLARRLRTCATEAAHWYCRRPYERLRLRLVYMLPRSLVYWCAIRLIAHATTGKHGAQLVGDLTAMDALDRWGHDA